MIVSIGRWHSQAQEVKEIESKIEIDTRIYPSSFVFMTHQCVKFRS
jgi:hypothetical protein